MKQTAVKGYSTVSKIIRLVGWSTNTWIRDGLQQVNDEICGDMNELKQFNMHRFSVVVGWC